MSKAKAISKELIEDSYTRKFIFKMLVGSLMIISIFYFYMIGSITFNIVARKSLENTANTLGNNISQLELTYFNSMNDINKDRAISLGFVDAHSSIFASRSINHVAMR